MGFLADQAVTEQTQEGSRRKYTGCVNCRILGQMTVLPLTKTRYFIVMKDNFMSEINAKIQSSQILA